MVIPHYDLIERYSIVENSFDFEHPHFPVVEKLYTPTQRLFFREISLKK
jgi:hypothetical protein